MKLYAQYDQQEAKISSPFQAQDVKRQTLQYQPLSVIKNSLAKGIYKEQDSPIVNTLIQSEQFKNGQELKVSIKQGLSNTPIRVPNISVFSSQQEGGNDSLRRNQKDNQIRQKRLSVGTPNHLLQALDNSTSNVNKSNSPLFSEDQTFGSTMTTGIIKNKSNIDFDLGRQLKNNLLGNDGFSNANSVQNLRRKSGIEMKLQAQQELQQQLYQSKTPQLNMNKNNFNESNQFLLNADPQIKHQRRLSEIPLSTEGRYGSVDVKSRHNNIILPQIYSPQLTEKKEFIQPIISIFNRENNTANIFSKKTQINRPLSRSSLNSQLINLVDSPINTKNALKINLPMKDIIQSEQKQVNSQDSTCKNSVDTTGKNTFQSINNGLLNDRSPKKIDEYLCNRRKSVNVCKNYDFSLQSPQGSTSNKFEKGFSSAQKQVQNSQFFSFKNPNQQQSKQNEDESSQQNSKNYVQKNSKTDRNQIDDIQQVNANQTDKNKITLNKEENDKINGIKQPLSQDNTSQLPNIKINNTNRKSIDPKDILSQNNNIQSLLSQSNYTETQNNNKNNQNQQKSNDSQNLALGLDVNSQNTDLMCDQSPLKTIQPVTLTQINTKEYENIKNSCLELLKNQIFCESFHQTQFEKAAQINHQEQVPQIVKFTSLCLEELQHEINLQIDGSNSQNMNLKEVNNTERNSINNFNIQWPKFTFKYPEKFGVKFVERITFLLEQNDFLRKKIVQFKKIASHNFKKYFCYRDLVNEIGGVQNILNIINLVMNNLFEIYQNKKMFNYIGEIKQFGYSLVDKDISQIESLIRRYFILSQEQQIQDGKDDTLDQLPKQSRQQSQNSFSSPQSFFSPQLNSRKESVNNTTQNFAAQQQKLAMLTGMKVKKQSQSSQPEFRFSPKIFFNIKYTIYVVLSQQDFVSSLSTMNILEQLEQLRYNSFRQFFGNDVALTYSEHVNNIINLLPDSNLIQLVGNHCDSQTRQKNYHVFLNQFCEHILIQNTSVLKIKEFIQSQGVYLNPETVGLLESQINYVLGAMKIIPSPQKRDIKDKFSKLKRLAGNDIYESIYENISEISQELSSYCNKQLNTSKQLSSENITTIKQSLPFFKFILESYLSTTSAFSFYDISSAYCELNLKEESLNYWIKSLKRALQKFNFKISTINIIEQQLTDIVNNKAIV